MRSTADGVPSPLLPTMTVWGDDVDQETVQGYIEVARRMTEGEAL